MDNETMAMLAAQQAANNNRGGVIPPQSTRNNVNNGGRKMNIKERAGTLVGEKFMESLIIIMGLGALGWITSQPIDPAVKKVAVSTGVFIGISFTAFIILFLDLVRKDKERAVTGYILGGLLLSALISVGITGSTIMQNVAGGGRVIVGDALSGVAGAATGVVSGGVTNVTTASTSFTEAEKARYSGTVPCQKLDWGKASNANVQNGVGGSREWCEDGANSLAGSVSAVFAKTCGCVK